MKQKAAAGKDAKDGVGDKQVLKKAKDPEFKTMLKSNFNTKLLKILIEV